MAAGDVLKAVVQQQMLVLAPLRAGHLGSVSERRAQPDFLGRAGVFLSMKTGRFLTRLDDWQFLELR